MCELGGQTLKPVNKPWKAGHAGQRLPNLADHGTADKRDVCRPGGIRRRIGGAGWVESFRIRGQWEKKGSGKAHVRKPRHRVPVPGENRAPGAGLMGKIMENQLGIVYEPGSQGQVEVLQERKESALAVQSEMIDGEKKIRPEGGDGVQQGLDKTGLPALEVRQGKAVGGNLKALEGGRDFSDQKIPALDKKNPGFGLGKLGIIHAPPKSGPSMQPVGHGRIIRPIEPEVGRMRDDPDAGFGRGGKVRQNLLGRSLGVRVGDDDQPGIGRKAGGG